MHDRFFLPPLNFKNLPNLTRKLIFALRHCSKHDTRDALQNVQRDQIDFFMDMMSVFSGLVIAVKKFYDRRRIQLHRKTLKDQTTQFQLTFRKWSLYFDPLIFSLFQILIYNFSNHIQTSRAMICW